jgi:Flp pilus assembly protein CpaB
VSSRRMIILIVAIVVAALSAFGLLTYVRSIDDAAQAEDQAVQVWFVTTPIAKGTPASEVIEQRLINLDDIPVRFAPATAIKDPDEELKGFVAVTDLPPNTILVDGHFVSPNVVSTGITDRLAERDMVSVTFSVSQIGAAAYLVEPGDFVNILTEFPVTRQEAVTTEDVATDEAQASFGTDEFIYDRSESEIFAYDVRYVYQKAEILAIDKRLTADLGEAAGTEAAGGNGGLITMAVPPEALQIILGIGKENLYLSLVPQNYEPYPLPPIDLRSEAEILPAEDATRLTPYGSDEVAETEAP